ncbi:diphthine--ammonia ligase [Nanoarchaeota archaeon]
MKVAILYSGGKDSNYAVEFAKEKGWEIAYLLSVKPNRTDCYLFHFATVEHTPLLAKILGLKHHMLECTVADPKKEAEIVKEFVAAHPVDAVVLGGTGLQETQLKSIQEALRPLHIEAFAAHAGYDHDLIVEDMIKKGYKFMIAQIASDGLGKDWLGTVLDKDNFDELKLLSMQHGFHIGGEGGYYDTFVLGGPIFDKEIEVGNFDKNMEDERTGHIVINKISIAGEKIVNQ